LLISCLHSPHKYQMETLPFYKEDFILSDGIKLHYLDWGGSGQPLVLIHGLGDSPYIFEDIATDLKTNFRIIAYSKRGHCKSETTDLNFDNSTLVSDLKLLLDSLNINKANLLGWSMGGNEITEFAIRYPERTNKLIYLEAGYDLSEEAFKAILKTIPKSPFPDSTDLSSLNAYRKWYHSFWFPDIDWNPTLEANLKASTSINQDSSITTIPNDYISKMIFESAMNYHREYEKIHAPSLVIYTKTFFCPPDKDIELVRLYENMERDIINPWRLNNMKRIKKELKSATIKTVSNGSHTSFIFQSKEYLIELINLFLLE
jgi:pimeloyl-ACP methyl ester carboxylesterase